MTNSERGKILTEQADFLHREAESLKTLAQSGSVIGQVNFRPDGLKSIGEKLEAISKYVKSVADDINAEGTK